MSKEWRSDRLLPRALKLAGEIYRMPHITGVALTGSVARGGLCHDIDLVLFNDGSVPQGTAAVPADWHRSEHHLAVSRFLFAPTRITKIRSILDDVPLHLIAMDERVLVHCENLKSMNKWHADLHKSDPVAKDFYLRVLCQLPLLLLLPAKAHFLREKCGISFGGPKTRPIQHRCSSYPHCAPEIPWASVSSRRQQDRSDWGY